MPNSDGCTWTVYIVKALTFQSIFRGVQNMICVVLLCLARAEPWMDLSATLTKYTLG